MIVFGLLTTILPIVILIFIIAFVAKNKEKGDEIVIRHLYTYLVLFATLMMVIGGGISIFMAAADLISPPSYYQSYTDYKDSRQYKEDGNKQTEIDEDQLLKQYEQLVKDEKTRQQENAKNQIIKSLGFIVIPLPIFLYFNNMRRKQAEI